MGENSKKIKSSVKDLIKMEDSYDDSMFGHFLDSFVTEYITQRGPQFVEFFNRIMEEQPETIGSYGDADFSITKLKVRGIPSDDKHGRYAKMGTPPPPVTWRAIQCLGHCYDNAFIVFHKSTNRKYTIDDEYFVYQCPDKMVKTADFGKITKCQNFRDKNFIVGFKSNYDIEDGKVWSFDNSDYHGGVYNYNRFYNAFRELRGAMYDLEMWKEEATTNG